MAIDVVELLDREPLKRIGSWEVLLKMLHALVQAEHPHAYVVATERRAIARPRA